MVFKFSICSSYNIAIFHAVKLKQMEEITDTGGTSAKFLYDPSLIFVSLAELLIHHSPFYSVALICFSKLHKDYSRAAEKK
jgi:hypothetical protein